MSPDSPLPNPHFTKVPEDTDILVTHGPPKGFVDDDLGCADLTKQVTERIKPRLLVCGHIHSAHGETRDENGTIFVNAAIQKREKGQYDPIVVELTMPCTSTGAEESE